MVSGPGDESVKRSEDAAMKEIAQLRTELEALKSRVNELRLGRQVRGIPRALNRKVRRRLQRHDTAKPASGSTILLLCHKYSIDGTTYGGQPIARRVPFYLAAGHQVVVYVPNEQGQRLETHDELGARVVMGPIAELPITAKKFGATHLAVHSPTPEMWAGASELADELPTTLWIHGFEARDWRLLSFDFSEDEIEKYLDRLEKANRTRRDLLWSLFDRSDIQKVFVSQYMRTVAEEFVGKPAVNGQVIHNVIDPAIFHFEVKPPELRNQIVSIRSFERRNYGTDLATLTITSLKSEPWFDQLHFRVIGDGRHHEEDVEPLRALSNVSIEPRIMPAKELRPILSNAGISLLPTRWDSQGMMMGESMMAGLVPITNAVAAIPEFVDEKSGIVVPPEDFEAMAEAIARMVEHPDEFVELSKAAHERVLRQCGPGATVAREIEIFTRTR